MLSGIWLIFQRISLLFHYQDRRHQRKPFGNLAERKSKPAKGFSRIIYHGRQGLRIFKGKQAPLRVLCASVRTLTEAHGKPVQACRNQGGVYAVRPAARVRVTPDFPYLGSAIMDRKSGFLASSSLSP
ncbi:MAG: hypothetical protein LBD55_06010, partial [Treponema sp.]|nr:hypothetical protein [Treponema sp.]